jgi:hypothetical protein
MYLTLSSKYFAHGPRDKRSHANDRSSICAIAGLGGHAWGSFKYKGVSQSFMWVLDGLRDRLRNARLMTYGSKTRLDGNESTQTLEDLGKLLRDEMRSVTKRRAQSVLSSTSSHLGTAFAVPSYFIAHSLGGLTVKEVIPVLQKSDQATAKLSNRHYYRKRRIQSPGPLSATSRVPSSSVYPAMACMSKFWKE